MFNYQAHIIHLLEALRAGEPLEGHERDLLEQLRQILHRRHTIETQNALLDVVHEYDMDGLTY